MILMMLRRQEQEEEEDGQDEHNGDKTKTSDKPKNLKRTPTRRSPTIEISHLAAAIPLEEVHDICLPVLCWLWGLIS